jgi:hypothetical protein
VRASEAEVFEAIVTKAKDSLTVGLALDELSRALPPLPPVREGELVPLQWKLPRENTHIGDAVRIGATSERDEGGAFTQ